ncbi:hypothetical protein BJ742DRAFT_766250 [Cladochytrium replicatum]|nr:hypothetical protein BJ742DRAFT_766250 [Cladochytrium replicatum]
MDSLAADNTTQHVNLPLESSKISRGVSPPPSPSFNPALPSFQSITTDRRRAARAKLSAVIAATKPTRPPPLPPLSDRSAIDHAPSSPLAALQSRKPGPPLSPSAVAIDLRMNRLAPSNASIASNSSNSSSIDFRPSLASAAEEPFDPSSSAPPPTPATPTPYDDFAQKRSEQLGTLSLITAASGWDIKLRELVMREAKMSASQVQMDSDRPMSPSTKSSTSPVPFAQPADIYYPSRLSKRRSITTLTRQINSTSPNRLDALRQTAGSPPAEGNRAGSHSPPQFLSRRLSRPTARSPSPDRASSSSSSSDDTDDAAAAPKSRRRSLKQRPSIASVASHASTTTVSSTSSSASSSSASSSTSTDSTSSTSSSSSSSLSDSAPSSPQPTKSVAFQSPPTEPDLTLRRATQFQTIASAYDERLRQIVMDASKPFPGATLSDAVVVTSGFGSSLPRRARSHSRHAVVSRRPSTIVPATDSLNTPPRTTTSPQSTSNAASESSTPFVSAPSTPTPTPSHRRRPSVASPPPTLATATDASPPRMRRAWSVAGSPRISTARVSRRGVALDVSQAEVDAAIEAAGHRRRSVSRVRARRGSVVDKVVGLGLDAVEGGGEEGRGRRRREEGSP